MVFCSVFIAIVGAVQATTLNTNCYKIKYVTWNSDLWNEKKKKRIKKWAYFEKMFAEQLCPEKIHRSLRLSLYNVYVY